MNKIFSIGEKVILEKIQSDDALMGFTKGEECVVASYQGKHYCIRNKSTTGYAIESSLRSTKTEDELYLDRLLDDCKG